MQKRKNNGMRAKNIGISQEEEKYNFFFLGGGRYVTWFSNL
jgi:hypothetical protein